ncbi:hypothetical protein LTR62_002764 [Meristemomyces frigidus]|uniref:Alpha/beta-hydrolase n=1 Tax=Meristemomyces frigidus TaxID=1508187 RepID=A0AAN7YQ30_9PEZI|nr:hypothetical protein LTR62_002764 [Meristemomyces frigidus]
MALFFLSSVSVCLLPGLAAALLQSQNDTLHSTFRLTPSPIAAAKVINATVHNVEVALNVERSNDAGSLIQAYEPSGIRNLWDEFLDPFAIALAGYAVLAPDYVGLAVPNVTSPYFIILPSQANDVSTMPSLILAFYRPQLYHAVTAAQSDWPTLLSEEFVVAGQSQGGAVAWSAAQRQHDPPVAGYLGTMAASPFTDVIADIGDLSGVEQADINLPRTVADNALEDNARVAGIAQGLDVVLPAFSIGEWLTPLGVARRNLLHESSGGRTTGGQLSAAEGGTLEILKPGWNESWAANWYREKTM